MQDNFFEAQAVQNNRSMHDVEMEISLLHRLSAQIPSSTAFGNSNEHALAAQIEVLRDQLNDEAVRDRYDNDAVDQYVYVCALFAAEWLYKNELAPSEDWLIMLFPEQSKHFVN
jgi:predicted RNase H-like nuclease